jgi:hypothetical protein
MAGGVELIAVDRGPGMPALGASPARGLGVGLQGVKNVATTFDLYTASPGGTVVLARILPEPPVPTWYRVGAVNVGVESDGESGDRWAAASDGVLAALVVDGLGHGSGAAEAALAAVRVFDPKAVRDLAAFLHQAHGAMRGTRGGVLGAAVVNAGGGELTFAGVGNVMARIVSGDRHTSLISREGVLGTETALRRPDPIRRSWLPGDILIMSSDGLRAQWDLNEYPGLAHRDPTVMAAVLHRDHGRANDDTTVLVVSDDRDRGPGVAA